MSGITTCHRRRPVPNSTARKVVEGFRTLEDHPLTENEKGWIEMLRLIVGDADPPPSLHAVQALRAVLTGE